MNSATVQSVIAIERTVFHRERAAGMYAALPYALAQVRPLNPKPKALYLRHHPNLRCEPLQ